MAPTLATARKAELKISFAATQAPDIERRLDIDLGRADEAEDVNGAARREALKLVRQGELPRANLFEFDQLEFLADCGPIRVNVEQLVELGPVSARRWTDVRVPGFDAGRATVERWEAEGLTFFEVSLKVDDVEGAADIQEDLARAVRALGLTPMPSGQTKTRQMLEHLAREQRGR